MQCMKIARHLQSKTRFFIKVFCYFFKNVIFCTDLTDHATMKKGVRWNCDSLLLWSGFPSVICELDRAFKLDIFEKASFQTQDLWSVQTVDLHCQKPFLENRKFEKGFETGFSQESVLVHFTFFPHEVLGPQAFQLTTAAIKLTESRVICRPFVPLHRHDLQSLRL